MVMVVSVGKEGDGTGKPRALAGQHAQFGHAGDRRVGHRLAALLEVGGDPADAGLHHARFRAHGDRVVLVEDAFDQVTGSGESVGVGRLVLSYPEMPSDVLAGRRLARKRICRTFSDCTTAPRNGIVSGCYPLDPHYKGSPEFKQLAAVKKPAKV